MNPRTVGPSPGPTRRSSGIYYPALDTLRGVFAISVVIFHFYLQQIQLQPPDVRANLFTLGGIGAFGVPFFFVLSSFLITDLLLEEKERSGEVAIGAFYGRRVLRVWPVYYAALLVGMFVIERFTDTTSSAQWLVPFAFFFANNMIAGQSMGSPPMTYAPLWSVSVEEQFYLIWPWIMKFASERALPYVGMAMILAAPIIRYQRLDGGSISHVTQWFYSFSHLDCFGFGVLACLAKRKGIGQSLQRFPGWIGIGVLGGLMTVQAASGTIVREPQVVATGVIVYTVVPLLAAILILACAQPAESLSRGWKHPVGLWFGRLSYGIYAYHGFGIQIISKSITSDPWISLVLFRALLAITMAFAVTSYYFLERPILQVKKKLQRVPSGEH